MLIEVNVKEPFKRSGVMHGNSRVNRARFGVEEGSFKVGDRDYA
jgi:hypothetical protein